MKQSNIGSKKEDFEVYEILGRGGFARVYRAKSLKTDQEVAIKIIDKKMTQLHGMTTRVRQEVELHSRLKHPSILELYTFFEDANYVYLVLEMCHNGEFQRKIKENGPLSENIVRDYLKQVVDGLKYLHSYNILHRDLTLANLLLTKDMKLKIADFGLATQLEIGVDHFTMCGTPNYISPEVVNRSRQGLESDVWSLGCMMYTMLIGKAPFDTKEIKGTLIRVQSGQFHIPNTLSDYAKDLIMGLLQTNPDKRLNLQQLSIHPYMQSNNSVLLNQEISISDSGIESMTKSNLSKDKRHSLLGSNTFNRKEYSFSRQNSLQCFDQKKNDDLHSENIYSNCSFKYQDDFKAPLSKVVHSSSGLFSAVTSLSSEKACNFKIENLTNKSIQNESQALLRSAAKINPFYTRRLRPIRQETRNVIFNILDDESVCLEFISNKISSGGFDKSSTIVTGNVYEVMCIDSTGQNILVYQPSEDSLSKSINKPPKLNSGNKVSHFTFDSLTEKYSKKYEIARRFVNLVKTKTPKLTMFVNESKCMMMENEPNPDFAVIFNYNEAVKSESENNLISKIHYHGESASNECTFMDGSSVNVDSKTNVAALSESLNKSLVFVLQCMNRCIRIVAQLTNLSNDTKIPHSLFPIILGRRKSNMNDIDNKSIFSGLVSLDNLPQFILESLTKQTPVPCNFSTYIEERSPLSTFIPDIGWATQMANGELDVHFNDGCHLVIVYDVSTIEKIRWSDSSSVGGVCQEFSKNDILTEQVHSKIRLLPLFVKQLRSVASQKSSCMY